MIITHSFLNDSLLYIYFLTITLWNKYNIMIWYDMFHIYIYIKYTMYNIIYELIFLLDNIKKSSLIKI